MRKLLGTLLLLMLIVTSATGETILCRPDNYVNVRASATTKSNVEGYLECGDEVETDGKVKIDEKGRKWVHIVNTHIECQDAWVCAMYVQKSPVTVETRHAYISKNGKTALRRSPNGKRVRWLKNGAELTVLAYSDEWALTTIGYVSMECIDFYGGEFEDE